MEYEDIETKKKYAKQSAFNIEKGQIYVKKRTALRFLLEDKTNSTIDKKSLYEGYYKLQKLYKESKEKEEKEKTYTKTK